jgi:hypothetical protein
MAIRTRGILSTTRRRIARGLMDFEVRHDAALPPDARHADEPAGFSAGHLGRLAR